MAKDKHKSAEAGGKKIDKLEVDIEVSKDRPRTSIHRDEKSKPGKESKPTVHCPDNWGSE